MSVTSDALNNIRKRTDTLNNTYVSTVSNSIGRYGKVAKEVFDRSIARTSQLLQKRQSEESALQHERERFTEATRNVLSKDTLDYLKAMSSIAAPTLTSIFTGFEMARADEAGRYQALLNNREDAMKRTQADDQLALREANNVDQQLLASEGNLLRESTSLSDRSLQSQLTTDQLVAKSLVEADQSAVQRRFTQAESALDRQSRLALANKQVEASTAEMNARQAFERDMSNARTTEERKQIEIRHENDLARIREEAKYDNKRQQKTRSFIDSYTPTSLPSTKKSTGSLAGLVSAGEGGYQSFNRGKSSDAANSSIDFSKMTVGDLMGRQSLPIGHPSRVFAFGANQITPDTMKEAVTNLGIPLDAPVTNELQDRIFSDYLVKDKRPAIRDYIMSKSNDVTAAVLDGAKEFASVENPATGKSYYSGIGNNTSSISSETFASELNNARSAYQSAIAAGMDEVSAYRSAVGIMPIQVKKAMPNSIEKNPEKTKVLDPTVPVMDKQSSVDPITNTLAEFKDSEDIVESLRLAAQDQIKQNPAFQGLLPDNPTLDEIDSLLATDETQKENERLKTLLATARYQEAQNRADVS